MKNSGIMSWPQLKERLAYDILLPKPINITIFRHGESEYNQKNLVCGASDIPLTDLGRAQAILVGQKLQKSYDLAFCSGLQRSKESLDIAIKHGKIKVGEIISDSRLNERSLGNLEGRPNKFIKEYASGDMGYTPVDGESYATVTAKLLCFLLDLAAIEENQRLRFETNPKEVSNILMCGHMGCMRMFMGIVNEEENTTEILGRKFSSTEVIELKLDKVALPSYLQPREVIPRPKGF